MFPAAGHPGEELHPQLREERLAEGPLQPRQVGKRAERPEDDAAGRRELGRDPAGRAGPMTAGTSSISFYTNTDCTEFFKSF